MKNPPLPIRDGLNPSQARTPRDILAGEFVELLVATQRHRREDDDVPARFRAREVVLDDATPLSYTTPLEAGTRVWFYRAPVPERPVPYEIREVYRDERILVVDKPPFLATMPRGAHITETALTRLRRSTGIDTLIPAHRLDRLTSGLLLFVIDPELRGKYQILFERRKVEKTYHARAPYVELDEHVWHSRIDKTRGIPRARIVEGPPNAVTEVLSVSPDGLYVLRPRTGKTHQLRLHMATFAAPIFGDPLYGDAPDGDFAHPMQLRAIHMRFTDPVTHRPLDFHL